MTVAAQDTRKRTRGRAAPATRRRRKGQPKPLPQLSRVWRLAGAAAILALSVAAWQMHRMPLALPLGYAAIGLVSFTLYGIDKHRAETKGWRIPEAVLHLVDFFGGIAGGLIAQLGFRHKTSKLPFILVSASFAALHVAALLIVLSPVGAALLPGR